MSASEVFWFFFVALGLSADCFTVALGGGTVATEKFWPRLLSLSLSFGAFQSVMLVTGWLAGSTVVDFVSGYDHWVAFALLVIVSAHMFREALSGEKKDGRMVDITRGWLLLMMSLATSIDSLAVGLSFAFLEMPIAPASVMVGAVALVVTALGFVLGRWISRLAGRWAELIGGFILLAIALRILVEHLLG